MFTLIISIIIAVAILLVLVILAQNSKGGGLSSQFGGSGASQVMGVKKTTDFLEKATWTLAIALLVLSVSTSFMISDEPTGLTSPNLERAQETPVLPDLGVDESNGATDVEVIDQQGELQLEDVLDTDEEE